MLSAAARHLLDRLAANGLELRPGLTAARRRLLPAPAADGLVSIIMPVRNRAGLVGKAIASVLAQSYLDWELLIVDDGSTDGTGKAIRPFLAHRRVRCVRGKARGCSFARNTGLRLARGGLVAYLDSDNEWHKDFLQNIVPAFADPAIQSAYGVLLRQTQDGGYEPQFEPFDHEKLQHANFIDLNAFVHRRNLITAHGGFDEGLKRLVDWDLILRYTARSPALPVETTAGYYHTHAAQRISDDESFSAACRIIRAKWRHHTTLAQPLRVLYALWQYPQASETYMETEIQAMRRLGVDIEVWSETTCSAPYKASVPVHRGTLAEAIAAAKPDVVHCHWLNIGAGIAQTVHSHGIPLTVRAHGFDLTHDFLNRLLREPAVRRVYLYPHQIAAAGIDDALVAPINAAFDPALITPNFRKNPRLVIRTSAGLPSKDLRSFLELARRFPDHRFVLAVISCRMAELYIGELLAMRREMESPAEILLNLPHETALGMVRDAGIYLHTALAPDQPGGTPLGMPISIAEAMASGCYVLVRDLKPLVDYVGDAGKAYHDIAEAEQLITETTRWDQEQWRQAATRASERAWTYFTGEDDFCRLHEDWVRFARAGGENPIRDMEYIEASV
jgi:glycosyltransferase involved in cell wall biosynthesis